MNIIQSEQIINESPVVPCIFLIILVIPLYNTLPDPPPSLLTSLACTIETPLFSWYSNITKTAFTPLTKVDNGKQDIEEDL